eukprot:TRINITY_DN2424_c0_g1_i1.p1 TRINITY_DN2424_c0_g1~~TRINITY_DN2424_c0_g1_i1.p1  ORF type:complete len:337 (-),score=169.54 TRINITY_DN2424_c0_g1_i1:277-1263(-)
MATQEPMDVSRTLKKAKSKFPTTKVEKEDDLQYDLGNLLAVDVHPINFEENEEKDVEMVLRDATRDDVQLLINKIFQLPTEKVDMDVVAQLPEGTTEIPREKPIPKQKPETKWDRFARTKGIKKTKRGRMLWDEQMREWRPRYGFMKANDESRDWIIPAKSNAVGNGSDPWEKMKGEKRERIQKQKKAQGTNIKRARGKEGGIMTQLMSSAGDTRRKTEKVSIDKQLNKARKSTASVGVFERLLPKEKKGPRERQRFNPLVDAGEKDRHIKTLDRLFAKKPEINISKAVKQFNKDPNFRKEVFEQKTWEKKKKESRKAMPHKKRTKTA